MPEPREMGKAVGVLLATVLAVVIGAPALADFDGQYWKHARALEIPATLGDDGLVEVILDEHVFANAQPDLQDLRVIEAGSGREAGYKLAVERGYHQRSSVNLAIRDLGRIGGKHTSFVADMGQVGALHNEIEIMTPSSNFQRTVMVESSEDRGSWAVLTDKAKIFDFTVADRGFNARDTRVTYPVSSARYLRITILDGGDPPLEIAGATSYFNQELMPREIELPLQITDRKQDSETKSSTIYFDTGKTGFPTSRIVVLTPELNFDRRVTLSGSDDQARWTVISASDRIYSYDTSRFSGEKLQVVYGESTFRYYRLTISNEDNAPIPVTGGVAYGAVRKVVFQAQPGMHYDLYYGNVEARAPSYDFERIFPYLVTEDLPAAKLGPHAPNPAYAEPTPVPPRPIPFSERNAWVLPAGVAIGGIVIGLFLANLLRQIKRVLPPPPDEPTPKFDDVDKEATN